MTTLIPPKWMIGRLKITRGKQRILWPSLPNGCFSQFIWLTSNPILENPPYFPHWTCTHLKMSGGSARFLMSTYHSTVKATMVSSQKVLMTFQVQSTKMQYLGLFCGFNQFLDIEGRCWEKASHHCLFVHEQKTPYLMYFTSKNDCNF